MEKTVMDEEGFVKAIKQMRQCVKKKRLSISKRNDYRY